MPIRELIRYRVRCDQCHVTADFEADHHPAAHLPEGWTSDDGYWFSRRTLCPACSEQREKTE